MKYLEYKKILNLTTIDELTGLYNRKNLTTLIRAQFSGKKYRQISILMIDIDHFKKMNDLYGRQICDKILASFGKTIKNTIRDYDIAGRYNGELFLVLLPDTSHSDTLVVANKIRNNFRNIEINSVYESIRATASIGGASLESCGNEIAHELGLKNLEELFEMKGGSESINWDQIIEKRIRISESLINLAEKALIEAKRSYCLDCGHSSLRAEEFESGICSACGGRSIESGRDKIILYPEQAI